MPTLTRCLSPYAPARRWLALDRIIDHHHVFEIIYAICPICDAFHSFMFAPVLLLPFMFPSMITLRSGGAMQTRGVGAVYIALPRQHNTTARYGLLWVGFRHSRPPVGVVGRATHGASPFAPTDPPCKPCGRSALLSGVLSAVSVCVIDCVLVFLRNS